MSLSFCARCKSMHLAFASIRIVPISCEPLISTPYHWRHEMPSSSQKHVEKLPPAQSCAASIHRIASDNTQVFGKSSLQNWKLCFHRISCLVEPATCGRLFAARLVSSSGRLTRFKCSAARFCLCTDPFDQWQSLGCLSTRIVDKAIRMSWINFANKLFFSFVDRRVFCFCTAEIVIRSTNVRHKEAALFPGENKLKVHFLGVSQ